MAGSLLSIGYEGKTQQELVAELSRSRVEVLVDVRLTPISRKFGLSKTRLSAALSEAGIEYLHTPALGNPKENREPFWTGDVTVGVRRFRELAASPAPALVLDQLSALVADRKVAVMCFERDHDRCHRQVVTEQIAIRCDPAPPLAFA